VSCEIRGETVRANQVVVVDVGGGIIERVEQRFGESAVLPRWILAGSVRISV
jgi:hypothetical protein